MRRYLPDAFICALLLSLLLATLWPCRGAAAAAFHVATVAAIALMFFLYGVRLSSDAMRSGLTHWRLHLLILACTFVLYPLLAESCEWLLPRALPPAAWTGVLFLALLPSTVQSSIAFTAIGGGNVAGAICAATLSNLLGTLLTPLLVTWLLRAHGAGSAGGTGEQLLQIATQLLLPFALGRAARPWLASWAARRARVLSWSDRSSILLVVYTAFSAAVTAGIWHQLSVATLALLLLIEAWLLASVLLLTAYGSRWLGFDRADRVAIVFCGSKKSLATGIPMANVLFAGPTLGMTVIPVMLFHQMQLMVASALAQRYAAELPGGSRSPGSREPGAPTAR